MEYFKDNDFFEKMEKGAVPKLDAARTSGYYTAYDGIKIYYDKRDEKYPYYIALNGQNIYSYDRKYQNYIQKFY